MINVSYSLLKESSIDYLLEITKQIEKYKDFVHSKGKRKLMFKGYMMN